MLTVSSLRCQLTDPLQVRFMSGDLSEPFRSLSFPQITILWPLLFDVFTDDVWSLTDENMGILRAVNFGGGCTQLQS